MGSERDSVRAVEDRADLIERSRRGDRGALGALLVEERPLLARVLSSFGGRAVVSRLDDLVQEASLEAVRAIADLREPERFRSWLVGIAVRVARRGRRSCARDRLVPVGAGEDFGSDAPMTDDDDDPALAAERTIDAATPRRVCECPPSVLAAEVERAVEELPGSWREVFVLRHGADLRYREIADALSQSESAIEAKLIRARRRIRAIVERRLEAGAVGAARAEDRSEAVS